MKYRFAIGFDDRVKLKAILIKFGSSAFKKSTVVKENIVPDLTSGDISRWSSNNFIEEVSRDGDLTVWRLSNRAINILKRDM